MKKEIIKFLKAELACVEEKHTKLKKSTVKYPQAEFRYFCIERYLTDTIEQIEIDMKEK